MLLLNPAPSPLFEEATACLQLSQANPVRAKKRSAIELAAIRRRRFEACFMGRPRAYTAGGFAW